MKKYVSMLESYLIPTKEGFFSNLFGSSPKESSHDIKLKADMAKRATYEQTNQKILLRMKEECPDELKKELGSRLKAVNVIIKIVQDTERKFKKDPNIAGFYYQVNRLKKLLKYPNISEDDWEDYELRFFSELLPSRQISTGDGEGAGYYFPVISSDLHDWNYAKYHTSHINWDDYSTTEAYDIMTNTLMEYITTQCKRNQHLIKASADGDREEGIITITLKPSDQFIAVAKKYGYEY